MKPTALIFRTAGTNCDRELAHAFELAGATAKTVHLNALIADPTILETCDIIGIPGGFSYGDDIAAGRIFANRLRHGLYEPIAQAVERGVPIIGVCNGFQVLVKMGLLPFPEARQVAALHGEARQVAALNDKTGVQCVTLADNVGGRFIDQWVPMQADAQSRCVWTKDLGAFELPIAHGEGRFVADPAVLAQLREQGQIALRYAPGHNPNGSMDDIAGVCDPTGLVLGLMPHPERFTHPTQHPSWTRQPRTFLHEVPAGLRIFRNAVTYANEKSGAASAIA